MCSRPRKRGKGEWKRGRVQLLSVTQEKCTARRTWGPALGQRSSTARHRERDSHGEYGNMSTSFCIAKYASCGNNTCKRKDAVKSKSVNVSHRRTRKNSHLCIQCLPCQKKQQNKNKNKNHHWQTHKKCT